MSLCYDFQKWTIISLALVAISLTVGLISLAYGQPVQFKNYTNNDLKFSIQYPSNWEVKEKEEYPNSVTFQIPDRAYNSSFFMVSVGELEPHFDTDTMTLKNNTLEQEVKKGIDTDISIFKSKLLKQNKVIVGGNTGIKTELIDHFSGYKFYITTIANGKVYQLSYIENPLKVPETSPLANKMVESFKVIK
jgi:photosystem II reaction center protein PsbP